MAKLTDRQREISQLLEDSLVGQKLPLPICDDITNDNGEPLFTPKKQITKKAVQALVEHLFPDDEEEEEEEENNGKDKD